MSKNPKQVLGDGAKGDVDEVENGESTVQPGLVETDEKAGATLTEQQAADLRAEQKAAKADEKKEND